MGWMFSFPCYNHLKGWFMENEKQMVERFKVAKGIGYECSTKGDKRFSALCAKLSDGRTIEEHYQCDIKGYDPGGTDWKRGKGKPPLSSRVHLDLWEEYLNLWRQWAHLNPSLMEELREKVSKHGDALSDAFAAGPIHQARALASLLNEGFGRPKNKFKA